MSRFGERKWSRYVTAGKMDTGDDGNHMWSFSSTFYTLLHTYGTTNLLTVQPKNNRGEET